MKSKPNDFVIRLACLAILLVIAAAWLSTLSGGRAGANRPLVNGLNTTPILETNRGVSVEEYKQNLPPILNPGKPSLPCPECADWRVRIINDRAVVKYRGRDVTRGVVGPHAEMSSRTPLGGQ